jgi:uncharacterized protein
MKRFAELRLKSWLENENRKPLIIRGARQVGKSTLVRLFADSQKRILYELNLERHHVLESAFKTMDVTLIIREVEIVTKKAPFDPGKCILFLDEIQAIPAAIQALRYFYKQRPDIPVVAAGSLLEFALQTQSFSMPVGRVDYLHMGPMTFEEFLEACGEQRLLNEINSFELNVPTSFSEAAHESLNQHLRNFLFIGGMPEAVNEFIRTQSIAGAFPVHASIVETYRDDFGKYASAHELDRLQRLFDALPGLTGGKFKYVKALAHEQPRDIKSALMLLVKAGIAIPIFHSSYSGLPLTAGINEKIFKIILVDIGLFNAVQGIQGIPPSVLLEKIMSTEGKIAEQFIGQHLIHLDDPARRPALFYWVREGRTTNAEVDFIVSRNGLIIPVEIKAGKSGSLRSLHQFVLEKKSPLALRFDLNPPSVQTVSHMAQTPNGASSISFKLLSLPLYMIGQCKRLLDAVTSST